MGGKRLQNTAGTSTHFLIPCYGGMAPKRNLLAGINTGLYCSWHGFSAPRVQIISRKWNLLYMATKSLLVTVLDHIPKRIVARFMMLMLLFLIQTKMMIWKTWLHWIYLENFLSPLAVATSKSSSYWIMTVITLNQSLCHHGQRNKWFVVSNYATMSLYRLVSPHNCSNLIMKYQRSW